MLSEDAAALRQAARSAARWLALVESGTASEHDLASLQRWRQAHERHEQVWHKALALRGRFENLPAGIAMASLDRPDRGRRQWLKGALGLAVVAPAAGLVVWHVPVRAWRADLSTATGERREVVLADGSVLTLNTATAVDLDLQHRRITLIRGEIALRLARERPFVVDTPQARAILARGELCVRQDGDACEFSVFAGQASIEAIPARAPTLTLQAGQRVRVTAHGIGPLQRFDAGQPGWPQGVLTAIDQPLGDFLRELDRYRPGVLRWAPSLEALRVTGSFRLDDTDRVLSLLAASLPLRVQTRTRYWVTLVPNAKKAA